MDRKGDATEAIRQAKKKTRGSESDAVHVAAIDLRRSGEGHLVLVE